MADVFERLRAREFGRLDAAGHAYLDYTGSGLYAESQVLRHTELLRREVLGNPHTESPTSLPATRRVQAARARILEFFDADPVEYDVIFTPNASGALKLVGESFPFQPGSRLLMTADNHNSVNGIRSFAAARGAAVEYMPLDAHMRAGPLEGYLAGGPPAAPSIFAFPAQSNFSGVRHPLEWVALARAAGYRVILDAAAFVPTSRLRLSAVTPDFVSVSFYKMFGYPTGVGALIARQEALAELRRPWFAGGTVRFVSAQNREHLLKLSAEAFEDGTLDFLAIAAVPIGLDLLQELGMEAIGAHVLALTQRLLDGMGSLRHSNGAPLVRVYGPTETRARGGTVALNALDPDGNLVPYEHVEALAAEHRISVRGGCFCNPGAAEFAFGYNAAESYRCFHTMAPADFTLQQFSTCMQGMPVGAIRASLGLASNETDVERLLDVLALLRDRPAPPRSTMVPEIVPG